MLRVRHARYFDDDRALRACAARRAARRCYGDVDCRFAEPLMLPLR